jgi:xylose isomerase
MDAFSRGLKIAHAMIKDGTRDAFITNRYASYDSGIGSDIESGKTSLDALDTYAQSITPPTLPSGRQEMLENNMNNFL